MALAQRWRNERAAPDRRGDGEMSSVVKSTAVYRAIMMEVERRRLALGLPMWKVDDLAGTQDGYLAKMLTPDSPSGRQAGWPLVQDVIDALFEDGFVLRIEPENGLVPSALGIDRGKSTKALQIRHWRHTRYFRDLGAKGGREFHENLSPRRQKAHQRHAAKIRWKKWRQRQREKTTASSCASENRSKPSSPGSSSRPS